MSKKQTYSVSVVDHSSYLTNSNGDYLGPIITRDCGHKHRTLSGANRCLQVRTKTYSDGTRMAMWYNATIRRSDGASLSETESEALLQLDYAKYQSV